MSESEVDDRLARLIRVIEGEIIPRLLVSFCGCLTAPAGREERDPATRLARLVLVREQVALADVTPNPDRAVLGLIAPAARRLGEFWEREECDLDQLFAGLCRLESLIREVDAQASGSSPAT